MISDDDLRAVLRDLAGQASPASITAAPLIRRAARRRAVLTATAGLCAAVVIAAVAAIPAWSGTGPHHAPGPAALMAPADATAMPADRPAPPGRGPWPSAFACGRALPLDMPGPAGNDLRISIGPVTRTATGRALVHWYAHEISPGRGGQSFGPDAAVALLVRNGKIVAVEDATQWLFFVIPEDDLVQHEPPAEQDLPRFTACGPADWAAVWAHPRDYQVVIAATFWMWIPPVTSPQTPQVRLSATEPLPAG